jgi:subtilisin family serine protease
MRKRWASAFTKLGVGSFVTLTVIGCANTAREAAAPVVDPTKVKTVLLAANASQGDTCESELRAAGANVLYRSESGALFADKAPAELRLGECRALVAPNESVPLEKKPAAPNRSEATAPEPDLTTLLKLVPAEDIKARSFIRANPSYDGRSVLVAILDTGVELDHPMLSKTSTGEDKIVDSRDFSGQGHVDLAPAIVTEDGTLVVPSGGRFSVAGIEGTEFSFGFFHGSTLQYSANVASKDTFRDVAVLSYRTPAGRRARLDLDGDGNFANDVEIYDFAESRRFVKLGTQGTLTAAVNLADDGTSASIVFDDGTHGSHVAGIAAGYDPKGLVGVAPGARLLSAKIGDSRLSGGSTTTASMVLAIDWAVAKGARIVNLSYGIRAGSNVGASAIDQYIDEVARKSGTLFSISAGNEGPGLLTVGTPAGASLAITNGAYVSPTTAYENYGYIGMERETIWWFSSVGPRLDGGLKPTLLAPGSALSAVPLWSGQQANYRGTSMASPQTTGGLALLLSAAAQEQLPTDRVSVTRAVYSSARRVEGLALVEQGHGLFDVPAALEMLRARKAEVPVEYTVSVTSPTAPGGRGAGVYLRGRALPSSGGFTATVTPYFPAGTPAEESTQLRTFRLEPTADWISVPPTLWMGQSPRVFQISLRPHVFKRPGLHSAAVRAVDEAWGQTAFLVPVTVVVPHALHASNGHSFNVEATAKPGETLRYFVEVPPGTTAVQLALTSDGPPLWAQWLDSEGRRVALLDDSARPAPLPRLTAQATVNRPGIYELDIVAPPTNLRPARLAVTVRAFSFTATPEGELPGGGYQVRLENHFDPTRVAVDVNVRLARRDRAIEVNGNLVRLPFELSLAEQTALSRLDFRVRTGKAVYDLMTDYPYRVFDGSRNLIASGGLELDSTFSLDKLVEKTAGSFELEIQGAFTQAAPPAWAFRLQEDRVLAEPIRVSSGAVTSLETHQFTVVDVQIPAAAATAFASSPGFTPCASLDVKTADGALIQRFDVCR